MELHEGGRYDFIYTGDAAFEQQSLDDAADELELMAGYKDVEITQNEDIHVKMTMEGPADSESLKYDIKPKLEFNYNDGMPNLDFKEVKEVSSAPPLDQGKVFTAAGTALGVTAIFAGLKSVMGN